MSAFDILEKKVISWIKCKELGNFARPLPSVEPPTFPETESIQVKDVPKLFTSVGKLEIAPELGLSIYPLASLMSLMNREDAKRVYSALSILILNVTIDKDLAVLWFTSCHRIDSTLMPISVSGFFELAELHQQSSLNEDLKDILAAWLKLLLKSTSIYDLVTVKNSLVIAKLFPGRFTYACNQLTINRFDEFNSLGLFLNKIPDTVIELDRFELLLEFTLETGCLLNEEEFFEIWQIVSISNFQVVERLKTGLVPLSSIRFLAGILKGATEKKTISQILLKERKLKMESLFGYKSDDYTRKLFLNHKELENLINSEVLLDFIITVVSCKISGGDQFSIGESISTLISKTSGVLFLGKINWVLGLIANEVNGETVFFLLGLSDELGKNQSLSISNLVRLFQIVNRILHISKKEDKAKTKNIFRSLVLMSHVETKKALYEFKEAVFNTNIPLESILSSIVFLLRLSDKDNREEYLSRIIVTGKLLSCFSALDRKNLISPLTPLWSELLFLHSTDVENTVIEHILQINSITLRRRYLETVVTRLLDELNPEAQMFKECLSYAITGYNLTDSLDKIRTVEHEVFKKALQAGGRVKVVDNVMNDLLSMPGFEGNKSEEVISSIQLLCNSFSRLAVWGEGGGLLFKEFISSGVNNILRAIVDNPKVLDYVNKDLFAYLLYKYIPEEPSTNDSTVLLYSGETAVLFFGVILPRVITLYSRQVDAIPKVLEKITEEFSRSLGGMIAGKKFASYLTDKLEVEISQEKVVCLNAWLAQKSPPPFSLQDDWAIRKRNEWNDYKVLEDSVQMKLFSLVSTIVGRTSNSIRDSLLKLSSELAKHIRKADINGASSLSLTWDRDKLQQIIELTGESSLFSLIEMHRKDSELTIDSKLYKLLELEDGFMETDVFHAWRQSALPQLLNCALEILIATDSIFESASQFVDSAMESVEFLGYTNANTLLSTLQETIHNTNSSTMALNELEKKFLVPLWKRNSASRINLILLGMESKRHLLKIINERLLIIEKVEKKVEFMRDYANIFLTVEDFLLSIDSDFEKQKIADALVTSWVFSGEGDRSAWSVGEISETVELVQDVFRRIKYGTGIVTASEASEISSDMRKKYRDNADSVAIILRWTIDPAREGLLQLLEESQLLLQAAGSDSELMRLLDTHGARDGFLHEVREYSEEPQALKQYLRTLPLDGV